jgi:hypothetical protein
MRSGDWALGPNSLLALGEQWFAAWRFGAALGWASVASLTQLADPRGLRRAWSANLTETIDRSLRSPEFLRLMSCQLRAMADVAQFTSAFRRR